MKAFSKDLGAFVDWLVDDWIGPLWVVVCGLFCAWIVLSAVL